MSIVVYSSSEAKSIMKKIGLVKDDYYGERGRTYFKFPNEGICCQATITKIGKSFYVSFFEKNHIEAARAAGYDI